LEQLRDVFFGVISYRFAGSGEFDVHIGVTALRESEWGSVDEQFWLRPGTSAWDAWGGS
jgi:hypothetical protein